MKENQHSDNLERFFKANLENYAPTPSADFWSRMETAIPPKPSFWSGWKRAAFKWAGLGLLIAALLTVALLWQRDRKRMHQLNRTLAEQQLQIEQYGKRADMQTETVEKAEVALEPHVATAGAPPVPIPEKTNTEAVFAPKNTAGRAKKTAEPNLATSQKKQKTRSTGTSAADLPMEQMVEHQSIVPPTSLSENAATPTESTIIPSGFTPIPTHPDQTLETEFLAFKSAPLLTSRKNIPSIQHKLKRPSNPYPGFSVEAGSTVFRMPLAPLFRQDTFLTGRTGISYATGLRINYELNPRLAIQVGYELTNLRARRLALRYNSFPLMVRKRWAWCRRGYVEGKTGVSINSLLSARTDSDGQSVKGLKTTWLGLHGGLAATWPLSDKLTLVVGPSFGLSLTPMTVGRRSWEVGAGASVRYQL